jgi:acyl homoserine lactone synthase
MKFMIEAFSLKTAHLFGDALASQARLRHRVFVERRSLDHTSYDGMEYDEFDTPAAVYFVWRDATDVVRGLIRLVPTSVSYQTEKYWPDLCQSRELPKTYSVWESTRVCVDPSFNPQERKLILPQLFCAVQEFCRAEGIVAAIGVTRKHLLEHYFRGRVEWLGAPAEVEGELECAFWLATDFMRPAAHCERFGITGPLLSYGPAVPERRVA